MSNSLACVLPGVAFAIGLMATASESRAGPDCRMKRVAAIPATIAAGHVALSGSVNGLPVVMVLDTGAPFSTVDAGLVATLGLSRHPTRMMVSGVDGSFRASAVRIAELRLGNGSVKNQEFVVQPPPPDGRQRPSGGIFGADFLRGYEVELNLAGGMVNLFSRDHCPGDVVYWDSSFYDMPMQVTRDLHVVLTARVNGETLEAFLDTGAATTAIERRAARWRLGLSDDDLAKDPASQTYGIAGHLIGAHFHRFAEVDLNGVTMRNWEIAVLDAPRGEPRWAGAEMLIGLDVISRFRMLISYEEGKIYFTPIPAPVGGPKGASPAPASPGK
jgi:predicted aspartyl protease